ncbi:MAG: hypothetical protein M1469_02730 [Bacteroidetes bacterium]|nr:hypothetical protein [Bacteroidota bacterium]
MALPNRVSAVLTEEDLGTALSGMGTTRGKLPFLIELKKEERRKLVRIDESAQPWTARFDVAEMRKDVELWSQMIKIDQALTSLKQLVEDTVAAVAVDAYSAALVVYHLGRDNEVGVEGLEDLMDEFGKRFAHKSSKSAESAQTPQK